MQQPIAPQLLAPPLPTAARNPSSSNPPRELRHLFRTAAPFLLGLFAAILSLDTLLAWHYRRTNAAGLIGMEVTQALRKSQIKSPAIHTVILGDSVARQLFGPRSLQEKDVCLLTTNQAISMA